MPIKEILKIIGNKNYSTLFIFFIFIFISMILETLSIGLVIPLISIISDPKSLSSLPLISELVDLPDNYSTEIAIIFSIILIIIFFFLKNMFLGYVIYFQNKFTAFLKVELSEKLFSKYLNLPWLFHIENNSSKLIRNTNHEVGYFTKVVQSFLTLIAEILIIIGVTVLLVIYEPYGAMASGITILISAYILRQFSSQRLLKLGKSRQMYDALVIKNLQEGLGSIKDVQMLERRAYFIDSFYKSAKGLADSNKIFSTLNQIPRLWYEFVAVMAIGVMSSIILLSGNTPQELITVLGLFAAAAFRLLPSVNRATISWQYIKFGLPVIDKLYSEFFKNNEIEKTTPNEIKLNFKNSIKVNDVYFNYPGNNKSILDGVTFNLVKGQSIGIIGKTGAGKTTFLDIILGLIKPTKGEVLCDEININSNISDWHKKIGYVPQNIFLTDDTLLNNISFGVDKTEINFVAVEKAIDLAQLRTFVSNLPDGLNTIVGERGVKLSGGQRQRIGIARALYSEPEILVFDEATSSLDNETEISLVESISNLQGIKTLIVVAHRMTTIKNCDLIFEINNGSLRHKEI